MKLLLPLALASLVGLPLNARPELHQREVPATREDVQRAGADAEFGVAFFCSQRLKVDQGTLCEQIHHDDLSDAQARLMLRTSGDEVFLDGDVFHPVDHRHPRLVQRSLRNLTLGQAMTHQHVCPIVAHPVYGERYVDDHDRLCVQARRGPGPWQPWLNGFLMGLGAVTAYNLFGR